MRIGPAQEGTANATMDRFVHSLVETSREAGYHVLLFAGDGEDALAGYDDLLRSTAVDAFVVTDTYLGNPQAVWLEQRRAPFVAFGRPWDHPDSHHPWVDVDGAAGTELATTHLLDRGHQRIAWIGWRKDSWIGEDRRAGWSRALHARGLPTTGLASRVEDTVASGREASAVLLDEAQPTAFVCASDTLAIGVLHTLSERGLAPGRDVAVVGFDDSQVAQVVPPGLTSVRQPLEDVAVEIVNALEGLLAHPPTVGRGVLLVPTLALRGSS
jgi:DNA-binding LacI/PurR family transcriptional regulator